MAKKKVYPRLILYLSAADLKRLSECARKAGFLRVTSWALTVLNKAAQ